MGDATHNTRTHHQQSCKLRAETTCIICLLVCLQQSKGLFAGHQARGWETSIRFTPSWSFCFFIFYLYTNFKGYFPLTVIKNIDYTPCVVQYLLEPVLHPIACASHAPNPTLPLAPNHQFSVSVSLLLLCYIK